LPSCCQPQQPCRTASSSRPRQLLRLSSNKPAILELLTSRDGSPGSVAVVQQSSSHFFHSMATAAKVPLMQTGGVCLQVQ
jgi:hypothetical protein